MCNHNHIVADRKTFGSPPSQGEFRPKIALLSEDRARQLQESQPPCILQPTVEIPKKSLLERFHDWVDQEAMRTAREWNDLDKVPHEPPFLLTTALWESTKLAFAPIGWTGRKTWQLAQSSRIARF